MSFCAPPTARFDSVPANASYVTKDSISQMAPLSPGCDLRRVADEVSLRFFALSCLKEKGKGKKKSNTCSKRKKCEPMESGLGDCARISEQLPDQLDNVLRLGGDEQHTDCLKNNNPPPSSCSKQDPETEMSEESFFDCQESFDNTAQPDTEQELELKDEQEPEMNDEYFKELEKNLSDEEKQGRRDESTKLKEEGNANFSAGEYCKAEDIYTRALAICPFCYEKEKSILFSNRAAARMKMDKKEDAISDCTKGSRGSAGANPSQHRAQGRKQTPSRAPAHHRKSFFEILDLT
ncbi:tetratricopeptide repeat protein 1 isoform X2 [Polypterus senegalus]|uniref:tetratricopeptide repeat protein 1 isoform X2 n=1 Tax=Polypterus senegalus TaxID=55291 RepID=UPI0019637F4B|nr:tetratricopeptide repeat protein 1 isoform X2 [Polypterus senegalus]XP_039630334.1 tetratricopeptide repeat protein 1 isoform X2 [Polypterus senegalus]